MEGSSADLICHHVTETYGIDHSAKMESRPNLAGSGYGIGTLSDRGGPRSPKQMMEGAQFADLGRLIGGLTLTK
jgi:hypothetical protein